MKIKRYVAMALTAAMLFGVTASLGQTDIAAAKTVTVKVKAKLKAGKSITKEYKASASKSSPNFDVYSIKVNSDKYAYSVSFKSDNAFILMSPGKSVNVYDGDDVWAKKEMNYKEVNNVPSDGDKSGTYLLYNKYYGKGIKKNKTYYVIVYGYKDAKYTLKLNKIKPKQKKGWIKFNNGKKATHKKRASSYMTGVEITYGDEYSSSSKLVSKLTSYPKGGKKGIKLVDGYYIQFTKSLKKGTYKFSVTTKKTLYYKAAKKQTFTLVVK